MTVRGGDPAAPMPTPPRSHPIFDGLGCWEGDVDAGWSVNFVGVRTRVSFFSLFEKLADFSQRRHVTTGPPYPDENYFEWITLIESVMEARERFTMVELGAGWGRWLVNGAAAARLYRGLDSRLVGVEAEPLHFRWMRQHLKDNGIPVGWVTLHDAAVAATDGTVPFVIGEAADWCG